MLRIQIVAACLLVALPCQAQQSDSLRHARDILYAKQHLLEDSLSTVRDQIRSVERTITRLEMESIAPLGVKITTRTAANVYHQIGGTVLAKIPENTDIIATGYHSGYWHVVHYEKKGYLNDHFVRKTVENRQIAQRWDAEYIDLIEARRAEAARRLEEVEAIFRQKNNENVARLREEAAKLRAGKKLLIEDLSVSVNSAGGAEPWIVWEYLQDDKTIKYITFNVVPYNAVGDVQASRIDGKTSARLLETGPIKPGDVYHEDGWEPVWYNSTIRCIEIRRIDIEYMDGTRNVYVKDLPRIMMTDWTNSCTYDAQQKKGQ